MSGCKQCTQFGVFAETNQQNVYDECDQKKNHRIAESFSKYFFNTGRNRILSKIRVDYHRIDVKYISQSYKYRTEVVCQPRGTNGQDQISYDRLDYSRKYIIPRFLQKDIPDHYDQTDQNIFHHCTA